MSTYVINGITFIELNPEKKEAALKRGYEELIKAKRESGELAVYEQALKKQRSNNL